MTPFSLYTTLFLTPRSTLLKLLFRLYDPDDGRVLLDGADIRERSLADLREGLGIVPQDCTLSRARQRV